MEIGSSLLRRGVDLDEDECVTARAAAAAEPAAAPVAKARCAAGAVLLVAVAALHRAATAPTTAAVLDSASTCKPATSKKFGVSFYKRTSFSSDPTAECSMINDLFDESASAFNFTLASDEWAAGDGTWSSAHVCAARCTWTPLAYELHEVKTVKAKSGPIGTDDWVKAWNDAHGVLGGADWQGWDEWMALSTAFWVKSLSPFTETFDNYGLPYLQRTYRNPVDNVTSYAAHVVNPHTGAIIEIHSSALSASHRRRLGFFELDFEDYAEDECGVASELHFSTSDMAEWLTTSTGNEGPNSARYPMLLVRVSTPATRPEALDGFLDDLSLDLTVDAGAQSNCAYRSTKIKGATEYGAANGSYVEFSAVKNAAARVTSKRVADYETYVRAAHGKLMGEDRGWDSYIDSHLGLYVDTSSALDEFVPLLEAADLPYMPHLETDNDAPNATLGSVWTGGFSGIAVELHGRFDGSCLSAVPRFEFCHPT